MKLFIIDTETTDLDPSQGATIIELAWLMLSNDNNTWKPVSCCTSYIQYSGFIHPRAQAQHHIRADKLTEQSGAITRETAVNWLLKHIDQDSILVAHNVDFDSKFLTE
jgi:DNA polymerase III epsilon subunit-like protein